MLPVAVALMTVLFTGIWDLQLYSVLPFPFLLVVDTLLAIEFACMAGCFWYYRNGIEFARLS